MIYVVIQIVYYLAVGIHQLVHLLRLWPFLNYLLLNHSFLLEILGIHVHTYMPIVDFHCDLLFELMLIEELLIGGIEALNGHRLEKLLGVVVVV